jgi:hypothetical protein
MPGDSYSREPLLCKEQDVGEYPCFTSPEEEHGQTAPDGSADSVLPRGWPTVDDRAFVTSPARRKCFLQEGQIRSQPKQVMPGLVVQPGLSSTHARYAHVPADDSHGRILSDARDRPCHSRRLLIETRGSSAQTEMTLPVHTAGDMRSPELAIRPINKLRWAGPGREMDNHVRGWLPR